MSQDNDFPVSVAIIIIVSIFALGVALGVCVQERQIHIEAVAAGAAKWVIADEKTGETEFRWIKCQEGENGESVGGAQ